MDSRQSSFAPKVCAALRDSPRRLLSLVTGGNGHLGNNVVRELCRRGEAVWAGVRNPSVTKPFDDLACELIRIDIQDAGLMREAMMGVDVVYACAAAPFRMSAKCAQHEIYDVNMNATRILIHAAKTAEVRRVVFVSSIVALNFTKTPASEESGHSELCWNAYYRSKIDSDKLALRLGRELGVEVVVVLPGTLVGGDCFRLTEAYRHLWNIYRNKVPFDANVFSNWCDVKDVAHGCVQAALYGVAGYRYILAQEESSSIRDTARIFQRLYPKRRFRVPVRPSKRVMWTLAWIAEKLSAFRGTSPLLQTAFIDALWGLQMDCETSLTRLKLRHVPRSVEDTLHDAIEYLETHPHLVK